MDFLNLFLFNVFSWTHLKFEEKNIYDLDFDIEITLHTLTMQCFTQTFCKKTFWNYVK